MFYIHVIITTLISWCARNVLPLFYLAPANTIMLTYYISYFCLTQNESRRNHIGKTAGLPENRGPPRIYRGCRRL
jgi:hypothetical protein